MRTLLWVIAALAAGLALWLVTRHLTQLPASTDSAAPAGEPGPVESPSVLQRCQERVRELQVRLEYYRWQLDPEGAAPREMSGPGD